MAITSVDTALAQYNANLDWNTDPAKAQLAIEAVRYLIVNQPESISAAGRSITKNLPHLMEEKSKLEAFIGAAVPRAFGRCRRVGIDYANPAPGAD